MRLSLAGFLGIVVLLAGSEAAAQGFKSPAEVVPAKTLAYVELRQPGALAKEVARLLEGSYLSDVPDSLAPLLKKNPGSRRRGPDEASIAGLIFAPEVLQEFGRLQGAAFAMTGMDPEERDMPEFVVIVQPGDSHAPGFLMRLLMTTLASYGSSNFDGKIRTEMRGGFERIGECEGVGLYRTVSRHMQFGDKGEPIGKPKIKTFGPAVARLPDAILIGSTDLVKDVIRRIKGKGNGPSLAELPAFQKASKDFQVKPGIVAFANPTGVMELLEKVDLGREGRQALEIAKAIVNPKAFVAVGDQLSLDNSTLTYRRRIYLDPKEKSPIVELLPNTGFPRGLLAYAPADALVFAAMSNDQGEKRFQQIIELSDTIAKIPGQRDSLSQIIAKMEEKAGLNFGKNVLGKIRGAAIAMQGLEHFLKAIDSRKVGNEPDRPPGLAPGDAGKQPKAQPKVRREEPTWAAAFVLLVEATDAKAAAFLAKEAVPKFFALMGGEAKSSKKKIDGHNIFTLEGKRGYALHYGVHGKTLVLGPGQAAVVASLNNGKKGSGLMEDEKFAKCINNLKDPIAVAMARPMTLVSFLLVSGGSKSEEKSSPPDKVEKGPEKGKKVDPSKPAPPREKFEQGEKAEKAGQAGPNPAEEKRLKQFVELIKTEEPLLLSVTRAPDQLMAEATYPGLRPFVARLTNFFLEEFYRSRGEARGIPRPKEVFPKEDK